MKKKPDDVTISAINKSTNLALKRIGIFIFILLCSLFSVYMIIIDPEFLHNALSFKSIEDDKAVKELVYFSDKISKDTIKLNKNTERKIHIDNLISNSKLTKENSLYEILSNNKISVKCTDEENKKRIEVSYKLENYPSNKNKLLYEKETNNKKIIEVCDKTSRAGIFTMAFLNALEKGRNSTTTVFEYTNEGVRSYIDNTVFTEKSKKIIELISKNNDVTNLILKKYSKLLFKESNNISKEITIQRELILKNNKKLLSTIRRIRSDEYIYASVILQKIILTMLFVSIIFYFLKAIGSDLLFLRKLALIDISQEIIDNKGGENSKNNILLYNAIFSEVDKSGKVSDSIEVKTLEEISKILLQSRK